MVFSYVYIHERKSLFLERQEILDMDVGGTQHNNESILLRTRTTVNKTAIIIDIDEQTEKRDENVCWGRKMKYESAVEKYVNGERKNGID